MLKNKQKEKKESKKKKTSRNTKYYKKKIHLRFASLYMYAIYKSEFL